MLLKFVNTRDPTGKYGIIKYLDKFTLEGHECMVFEYLKGGDLYRYIHLNQINMLTIKQVAV
jgi:serine/threonine protein kinase